MFSNFYYFSAVLENYAKFPAPSQEDILIQAEDAAAETAAENLMLDHLEYALSQLTPKQARRLHARFKQKRNSTRSALMRALQALPQTVLSLALSQNYARFFPKTAG